MTLVRLPVCFLFPSHVTLTVLVCVMATRLDLLFVMLTISRLCLLLISGYVDSSLVLVLLAPSSLSDDFTTCSLIRLDAISDLYFYELYACLYLYCTDLYIYWVGDGTFPIFNLLCNHPSVVT